MILDKVSSALEVRILGLELEFVLNCGETALRSRQFQYMQIDID